MIYFTPKTFLISSLIVAGLLFASPVSADDFTSLEERMTGQEFEAAGLDKLSAEELAALNEWIRSRSLAEGESAPQVAHGTPADPRGTSEDRRGFFDRSETIRTRIDGTFNGWEGETEFRMENGMVWKTTGSSRFSARTMENPQVTISQTISGGWQMQVEGYNRRVLVRRVD